MILDRVLPPTYNPKILKNDRDILRIHLIESGYSYTKYGLKMFQKKYNIPETGIIDCQTRNKILQRDEIVLDHPKIKHVVAPIIVNVKNLNDVTENMNLGDIVFDANNRSTYVYTDGFHKIIV